MPTLSLVFHNPDVAVISIDSPDKRANVFSASVLDEFELLFDELMKRQKLLALIIRSAKQDFFVAGADISEFSRLRESTTQAVSMCRRGQQLFGRLSAMPFVTVAAIDGVCLGGGSEMSLWCDRRLMTNSPKSQFGLPEVKLGLIPGWGGTATLSRLIGLGNAIDVVTSGEPLSPNECREVGLVSDVVPADRLLDEAIRLVREDARTKRYLEDRQRLSQPIKISTDEREFMAFSCRAKIAKQFQGHNPAPEVALQLMLDAATLDREAACVREAETMPQVFGSSVNKALINIFFLRDHVKHDTGLGRQDVVPQPIERLGVIGAGVMGAGIAAAAVRQDIPVVVHDAATETLPKCVEAVLSEMAGDKTKPGTDPPSPVHFASRIQTSADISQLAAANLVIEAIVENAEIKRQLFARLEPLLSPHTILASNTSTIPITKLAEKLVRPEQFCGIHFFNPVRKMSLVEIIRGEKTSDETVSTAVAFCKRIGKLPIVVKDGPGFLVNRLLRSYLNEALQLLTEGSPLAEIERASFAFGMPIGPFTLYDMVGLDTAFYAGRQMWEAFPDRVVASPILPALIKAGRLGQKNGLGFFSYQNKAGKPEHDPQVDELLSFYLRHERQADQEEITIRLFLPMLLEATRILEEERVRDVRDIDLGVVFGLGFPAFRGGLMHWADSLGAANIIEQLKRIEFLGPRVHPTPLLIEMAKSGRRFYNS